MHADRRPRSGKTLAAFLSAIDELTREGLASPLPDEVRVIYVSPLKALSADIHKNLAEPRRGICRLATEAGLQVPQITAAVRTGDTSPAERAAMLRTPPHILVTTPESLYLLLTSERSRQMLRTVRTVIVDEIHAVVGTGAARTWRVGRLQQAAARSASGCRRRKTDRGRAILTGAPCDIVEGPPARDGSPMEMRVALKRSWRTRCGMPIASPLVRRGRRSSSSTRRWRSVART